MTLGIQLNISSAGVEQVTFIKNGVTGYKSYNGINVDTIIEKIIDAYTKRDSLENILP